MTPSQSGPVVVVVHPDNSLDCVGSPEGGRHTDLHEMKHLCSASRDEEVDVQLTLLPALTAAPERRRAPRRAIPEEEWCVDTAPWRHQTVYSRILDF